MDKSKMPFILTMLFWVAILSSQSSCLSKSNSSGIVDAPVVTSDNKYLVAVVAESEAVSHQENGGFIQTSYSTSYWLKQYEIATGKLIKKKELISFAEKNNTSVTCYGSYDNKIWLYVNGLQAHDINSLEEVMNEDKLAAANGIKKSTFPYGERLINAAVENGYIDFTADNGEEFRILLKNLKIVSKEDAEASEEGAKKSSNRLFKRDDDYGVRCDTLNNNMYALAKDSIAAGNYNLDYSSLNEVTYRMKFFKANYTMRQLGNHNSFDFAKITQQGNTTYLNPAFAKDLNSGNAIHLSQPQGYLVIHQDVVGSNSKAMLTRIDSSNKKIWETATGVSTKIAHCIVSGKYCIITANSSYMFSPHIGKDALCIVDTENGSIIQPVIKE